jgi:hypothetical protein
MVVPTQDAFRAIDERVDGCQLGCFSLLELESIQLHGEKATNLKYTYSIVVLWESRHSYKSLYTGPPYE